MGSALGLPQACGHNDFPEEVKKNEVPWQTIINKLSYVDSEKSFRKYSLAEITKLKENALALRLELQTIFDDLALGNDNFQKSLEAGLSLNPFFRRKNSYFWHLLIKFVN